MLNQLTYLTKVIKESLRLYSPVPLLKRYTERETKIGGYPIPAGTEIVICPSVIHRLPRYYEEPMTFNPDRWDEKKNDTAYLPFSNGPRNCIGAKFSQIEAKTILTVLLARFRFRLSPEHPVCGQLRVTLRPSPALMMHVSLRDQTN